MPIYYDLPDVTPVNELGQNARVSVFIDKAALTSSDGSQLADHYSWVFFTEATPLYASVDYIILKGGELMEAVPEAAIYLMSFTASTLVDDTVLFDEDAMFGDKTSQQWKFYNRAKTEFACCQAVVSMTRSILTNRGTSASRKSLADFSIDTGPLANLLQTARPLMKDMTEECRMWRDILMAGGAFDYDRPIPQAAVKSGHNRWSTAIGIGRGWMKEYPLNKRESVITAGNSWSRPSKFSHPRYYNTSNIWW